MGKEKRFDEGLPRGGFGEKVRQEVAARQARHGELVQLMHVLLRPGEWAKWSSVRRMLRLAGHAGTKTHAIAMALVEAFPDATHGRVFQGDRRPRVVFGVKLAADLETLRRAVAKKWEEKLGGEGMPSEIGRIAQEYKLSPLPANDNGYEGRLHQLVIRVHLRRQEASVYYGKATDYLWNQTGGWANWPGHKQVWSLHCEGATKEEIATETGLSETKVQTILDFHRARAGLTHR